MEKIKRIAGFNQSEIDVMNKAVEILAAGIDPSSKNKEEQYKAIQDKVINKYLAGFSPENLANMCK